MEGAKKIIVEGREIIVLDYSNCKESQMIKILISGKELVQKENKRALVLNILNERCYVTPGFVRQAEAVYSEIKNLIEKHAITGLSTVQKMILKGFNLFGKRNLRDFNSADEAIEYLIDKK